MRLLKVAGLLLFAFLVTGVFTPGLHADEWNKLTTFTFSGPFEIPGNNGPMVLPAGTYVFKLLDSASDRNIVQVFNKDQSKIYATILAIPDYRMKPTSHSVIRFTERATGSPEALRAWFYPGDNYGQQFVYPRKRAMELAKANNTPVLSMRDEDAANLTESATNKNDASVSALEKAPVTAAEPNGSEVKSSQIIESQPPAGSNTNSLMAQNTNTLPKTASDMPLVLLVGVFLIAVGAGLRRFAYDSRS